MAKQDSTYTIIILVFFIMILGTRMHDPVLHGAIAWLNGWGISDYSSGLTTGQTTATVAATASALALWEFYMFPGLFIFVTTIVATIYRPEREILIMGIILMAMNISSFDPAITGSDAYNAVQVLISTGTGDGLAYSAHYALLITIVILWAMYLYVAIETNPKDARTRIRGLK